MSRMAKTERKAETAAGTSPFATIEEAIEEIRAGRMVVVCDDETRENEGDLVVAAQFVTPDVVNFMAKEGRGLICLALTAERCDVLGLNLMAAKNEDPLKTAFTVSIDARAGVTTGISPAERAHTIQLAISPASRARSTPASVCPTRSSTPPARALSGNTCPGWTRSAGLACGSIATWIVCARS